jgi:ferric-dicitrate binding protein FerR (iron transport regulator)
MKRGKQGWMWVFVVVLLGVAGTFQQTSAQVTTVNGTVKLKQADGTEVPLTNGLKIASESTVTTGARSSAVVSLGKLGRVEVLPDTTMKLSYDDAGYTVAMLSQGSVRLSSSSNATVNTNDGSITTNSRKRTEFLVDTTCGDTLVSVSKGAVQLRAGETVKQIAAGNQDTAGTATPGCTRRQ